MTITATFQNLHEEVSKRTSDYPYRSQEEVKDPLVIAKLFDICGSATWYITEYDKENKIIFCYVEGLTSEPACDEWGSSSIQELSTVKWL